MFRRSRDQEIRRSGGVQEVRRSGFQEVSRNSGDGQEVRWLKGQEVVKRSEGGQDVRRGRRGRTSSCRYSSSSTDSERNVSATVSLSDTRHFNILQTEGSSGQRVTDWSGVESLG